MNEGESTAARAEAARIIEAAHQKWLAQQVARFPMSLFAYGFRPFFLACGAYAFIAMALWLAEFLTGFWPGPAPALELVHAHELFFGVIVAAITGFLLTAVPGWTDGKVLRGLPLAGLFGLWLLGRAAMLASPLLPASLVALVDLAFLPTLLGLLTPVLIRAKRPRNLPVLALLGGLVVANLLFHLSWLGVAPSGVAIGIGLALNLVLFLVAMIGGRVVPAFTLNALRRRGTPVEIAPRPRLDQAALALTALILPLDLAPAGALPAGIVAALAALVHAARLSRWHGHRTWPESLVWVLHVAYAWIPVALGLKALWLLGGIGLPTTWIHALTVGAFTGMILAVTTRASLGHTGRLLVAPRPIVICYGLIALAALIRVFVPLAGDVAHEAAVLAAGALWLIAFGLFVAIYAPILAHPRPDGRPG